MLNKITPTRRAFLGLMGGAAALAAMPTQLIAQSVNAARALVDALLVDLYALINAGRSTSQLYSDFETLLNRYADLPIIAQTVMGVDWRRASNAQRSDFITAFRSYIARKYGSRFQELIGGTFEITGARQIRNFIEVTTTANLRNEAPFEVIWLVSSGSGQLKFFNLVIEGINLQTTERQEIGAMLDRNGGNIDAMIADLRNAS
ncbi:MlaC/ttg2D family ABC transporter substrate-binding protein [Alterinioella nitratireducens]|jgi:phospholipid transport system substrate-binding protein|uniref:MlaC/ttg2D family ABC transporter substrate-binding protein n=1 Tax=Alterinioella nitratireducens TaxID=2735915 RepID=UPI0015563D07|nr:ABC transporter substrate-binding protein [Alterinioella nitratireducens]NPD20110.1 ABC transporter substrate-binding protein [Alterinioella nitratireducens]